MRRQPPLPPQQPPQSSLRSRLSQREAYRRFVREHLPAVRDALLAYGALRLNEEPCR